MVLLVLPFLLAPRSTGKAFKMPTTNPALSGTTTQGQFLPSTGVIELRPGLSWAKMREVLRHESVHKWFNPTKSLGPYTASVRRNIDGWFYNKSAFFNATEEIIAQGFATKSLRNGIQHAFNGLYTVRGNTVVSKWTYLGEAIPGVAGLGGLIYVGYGVGDWLWGNE
jgi:hypothetical protein